MLVCASTLTYAKDLKIVVPVAAGAVMDYAAKSVQPYLAKELDRNVIIEYYPGGRGMLARQQVLKNTQEGIDSIMIDTISFWVGSEDPNFIPISYYGTLPSLIVVRSDFKEPADFKTCKLKTPITYGSAGVMSPAPITVSLQSEKCRAMFKHVPYKGGSLAVADLLGGHIDSVITSYPGVKAHLEAGTLKVLYTIGPMTVSGHNWKPWQPEQYKNTPDAMALFFFMHNQSDPQLRTEVSNALARIYTQPDLISDQKKYTVVRPNLNMPPKEQFDKYLKALTKAVNQN